MVTQVLSKSIESAFLAIGSCILIRLASLVGEAYVLRLQTKELLGLGVRQKLLFDTLLFLSREAFRKACLSRPPDQKWQGIINLIWLTLPIGLVFSCFFGLIWIFVLEQPPEEYYTQYKWSILLMTVNLLFILAAEPFHVIGQAYLHVKFRSAVDMYWAICGPLSNILVVTFVSNYSDRQIWSGITSIIGSILFLLMHVLYFWFVLRKQNDLMERTTSVNEPDAIPFQSIGEFFPDFRNFAIDQDRWKISWNLIKQGIFRQALMDGEKYMFVGFHLMSIPDQGIYGAIENFMAVPLKLFYVKMEESTHLYFSQTVTREPLADRVKEALPTKHLHLLLKTLTLIGCIFVVFGIPYSHPLLWIYAGDLLIRGSGPLLLKLHMVYIFLLGVNVTSESYVLNALTSRQLERYNKAMGAVTVIYFTSVFGLSQVFGPPGFVLASILNLGLRLIYNFILIGDRHKGSNFSPLDKLLPKPKVLAALTTAVCLCTSSEFYLYADPPQKMLYHLSIGILAFLLVGIFVLRHETSLLRSGSTESPLPGPKD
ncbi:hypothetical protein TCAL_11913, partial [Tigriopus californicus]